MKFIDKCVGIDFNGRYKVSRSGKVYSTIKGDYLRLFPDGKRGYLKVKVYDPNNTKKRGITLSVHRLVKLTYDNLPYDYDMDVEHLDSDITNNRYSNLDLCSNKENIRRSIDRGSSISRSKQLSISTVHEICRLLFVEGLGPKKTAEKLDVSIHAVKKISQRKNYAYISEIYI